MARPRRSNALREAAGSAGRTLRQRTSLYKLLDPPAEARAPAVAG